MDEDDFIVKEVVENLFLETFGVEEIAMISSQNNLKKESSVESEILTQCNDANNIATGFASSEVNDVLTIDSKNQIDDNIPAEINDVNSEWFIKKVEDSAEQQLKLKTMADSLNQDVEILLASIFMKNFQFDLMQNIIEKGETLYNSNYSFVILSGLFQTYCFTYYL